jgi:hypothetical protein
MKDTLLREASGGSVAACLTLPVCIGVGMTS